MDQRKRSRAANFTPEEKRICLELTNKYKHVIENKKKTNTTSKIEKDEAWNKIADKYGRLHHIFVNHVLTKTRFKLNSVLKFVSLHCIF
jgi:protein tyrosine/serine phosphatase